jgi:hypothetical protein
VFLNKNPHLCNKLGLVNALFPDARFVWIYRPLFQVTASLKRLLAGAPERLQIWHYWPPPQPNTQARCWQAAHQLAVPVDRERARLFPGGNIYYGEYWLESYVAVAEFLRHVPADRRLAIREEDLIDDTSSQIAKCLRFLGQSSDVPMEISKEINHTRNLDWKSLLTQEEIGVLQEFQQVNSAGIETVLDTVNRLNR